eukprot:TRINITY_DN51412_c0_g1_i1.p1 TRINITY_DN51412_c0_g1~~TRINITY_DN51412_c0_g1_i1.p1  ORF type:complete len:421 (+),score=79.90 TRINITY_DN51412_c0_g1_i1:117-1379(+)
MASKGKVVPILGTMTFGADGQVKPDSVGVLLRSFIGSSCTRTPAGALIDTARIYQQATPDGDTESTLGEVFDDSPSLKSRLSIATKADKGVPPHYSLSKISVLEQCDTSLDKLGVDSVDLFYLHAPDINTDIAETLEAIDELHKAGKIKEFGLSNYPAWAVVDIWHRCKSKGMVLPTVWQGMYNVITRDLEREIVPVARRFGLRLYIYNPLAGGLLSGRYSNLQDVTGASKGRFSEEFDQAFGNAFKAGTGAYRGRYAREPILDGLAILRQACTSEPAPGDAEASVSRVVQDTTTVVDGRKVRLVVSEGGVTRKQDICMAGVALRWLIHHSCLQEGDGIIFGVSKSNHLTANLGAWQAGPLADDMVEACNKAWEVARPACESYFRGLGAKPGGVELFLAKVASQQSEDATAEPAEKKARR